MRPLLLLVLSMSAFFSPSSSAAPLDGLRPGHPRVLATDADFERIAGPLRSDQIAVRWMKRIKQRGDAMLDEPVAVYELRDGQRLLYVSREVLDRSRTLAMLYRVTNDRRYLDRLWADMEAVANFPHWNPAHFLDVGEMSLAVAIAYDWCYDAWSEEQRAAIREGLIKHGLDAGLKAYEDDAWWATADMNWNQVCNGGLIAAALALADDTPEKSARMVELAVKSLPLPMARYNPRGGYDEGAGYWNYGTSYNVYALAALQSALGHDFGLGDTPGFNITGDFVFHMTGPTGKSFNFADAQEGRVTTPIFLYLAQRYHQPAYAAYARKHNRGDAFDLLWHDPDSLDSLEKALPLSAVYDEAGAATLRSAWDDPDALFLGVKGGDNGKVHGQHDLGSFVLDADGVRWFIDPGRDDYNLPGYFDAGADGRRWTYYRNRAEGHNTVVVNPRDGDGPDQRWHTTAPLSLVGETVRVDLSAPTGVPLQRAFTFDAAARTVTVRDEVGEVEAVNLWWFAHTRASITLHDDGRRAVLTQDGKTLTAELLSPADATFAVMDARPLRTSPDPQGQNPNNGATLQNKSAGHFVMRGELPRWGEPNPHQALRKLAVHVKRAGPFKVVVELSPGKVDKTTSAHDSRPGS